MATFGVCWSRRVSLKNYSVQVICAGTAFWFHSSIKIKLNTRDEAKSKCHIHKAENNLEFLEYMTCQCHTTLV